MIDVNHGYIKLQNELLGSYTLIPISNITSVTMNLYLACKGRVKPAIHIYDGSDEPLVFTYDTPEEAEKIFNALESVISSYYLNRQSC